MSEMPPEDRRFEDEFSVGRLARDYELSTLLRSNGVPLEKVFPPREAALLSAIASNPESAKLMNDYKNHLPERQGMPTVGAPHEGDIQFSEQQRRIYEDLVVMPSLIAHNVLSGLFWKLAMDAGYDRQGIVRATELGKTIWDAASAVAAVPEKNTAPAAVIEGILRRGVDPDSVYRNSDSPLGELGIKALGPDPAHERQSEPTDGGGGKANAGEGSLDDKARPPSGGEGAVPPAVNQLNGAGDSWQAAPGDGVLMSSPDGGGAAAGGDMWQSAAPGDGVLMSSPDGGGAAAGGDMWQSAASGDGVLMSSPDGGGAAAGGDMSETAGPVDGAGG
jgi:hypothetical protein